MKVTGWPREITEPIEIHRSSDLPWAGMNRPPHTYFCIKNVIFCCCRLSLVNSTIGNKMYMFVIERTMLGIREIMDVPNAPLAVINAVGYESRGQSSNPNCDTMSNSS